jgi:hypothetical protein
VRFENENNFFNFEKRTSPLHTRINSESVGLTEEVKDLQNQRPMF